ncbi:MAG: manganese efflux pump MntP family protein [Thermomicrobia bacterium]|nr:manganese efflux pump MntP family protein [Thermomicrobia bacterium]
MITAPKGYESGIITRRRGERADADGRAPRFVRERLATHDHSHDDEEAHTHAHAHGLAHTHTHAEEQEHEHEHAHARVDEPEQPLARRLSGVVVAFGVAASPDLTVLPVALAASAVGIGAVAGVLIAFTFVTMATFVGLTVIAMLAGYQIKGEWLEKHATTITAIVLIAIGMVAFVRF